MEIDKQLAQNIVNSIKEIVHYEINFINIEGKVIASTDLDRIDTFHEGGWKVYKTKKDLSILSTDKMQGSLEGYNAAVYFREEIIGIIGITGPADKVTQFANIIKKMTELMVKEAYLINIDYTHRYHQRNIIEFITSQKGGTIQSDLPILNYDLSINRRAIYTEFPFYKEEKIDLYHVVQNFFPADMNLIVVEKASLILYVTDVNKDFLNQQLNDLNEYLYNNFNMNFFFGIGGICDSLETSRESYEQAKYVYHSRNTYSNRGTAFFDNLTLELLFIDWDDYKTNYFCNKIIGNIKEDEVENYEFLLQTYEQSNGSILECAEKLYIHKNTVQYRLNKLEELTGYNPRVLTDFVLLKIAFVASKMIK